MFIEIFPTPWSARIGSFHIPICFSIRFVSWRSRNVHEWHQLFVSGSLTTKPSYMSGFGCVYSFTSSISSSYKGVGLVPKPDADPRHDHQQNAPWDCLFTLLIITSLHRQTREVLLFLGSHFLTRLYGCSLHSWACNHIPNPQRPRPMPAHPHESRPHFTNRIMHLMPWKQNHSGIRSRQESVGKIIE